MIKGDYGTVLLPAEHTRGISLGGHRALYVRVLCVGGYVLQE